MRHPLTPEAEELRRIRTELEDQHDALLVLDNKIQDEIAKVDGLIREQDAFDDRQLDRDMDELDARRKRWEESVHEDRYLHVWESGGF